MKTKFALLFVILLIAVFARFWNLNSLPPSLFSDEVDAGYQAMIYNHSGTDYFGNKNPVHFHSFSDWRTSADIYSMAAFQKVGFSPEASVRLPSAIFGLISVVLIFLITDSPIAAFLLAISPWAIHYSRSGFEVSGMIMVILAGIYFWQKYLESSHLSTLLLSIFFFCLAPYFYSTANLFLPIIGLLILIIWHEKIFKLNLRHIIISLVLGIILMFPLLIDTVEGKSGFRFSYIGIFTMPHLEQITDTARYEDILQSHPGQIGVATPLLSKLLHNKYQLMVQKFIANYYQSFSPDFLFLTGDNNLRQGFGGHGLLYLLDAPLLLWGLFLFFKKPDKQGTFFFWLLVLAPIPFALTRDSNSAHATRLILMLPSLIYFITKGINKKYILVPVYCLFFLSFWHYYTIHYPQTSAVDWHSGMKESVLATNKYQNQNIYFSDSFEPFLPFFLFYRHYFSVNNLPLPQHLTHFQNSFFDGQNLDNQYYFGHLNWDRAAAATDSIFVIPQDEYLSLKNQSSFSILNKITKAYLSAQDFYLITPNSK